MNPAALPNPITIAARGARRRRRSTMTTVAATNIVCTVPAAMMNGGDADMPRRTWSRPWTDKPIANAIAAQPRNWSELCCDWTFGSGMATTVPHIAGRNVSTTTTSSSQ